MLETTFFFPLNAHADHSATFGLAGDFLTELFTGLISSLQLSLSPQTSDKLFPQLLSSTALGRVAIPIVMSDMTRS